MEEAIVIVGTAVTVIALLVIPFYFAIHILMNTWDGSDKTKQYRRD